MPIQNKSASETTGKILKAMQKCGMCAKHLGQRMSEDATYCDSSGLGELTSPPDLSNSVFFRIKHNLSV